MRYWKEMRYLMTMKWFYRRHRWGYLPQDLEWRLGSTRSTAKTSGVQPPQSGWCGERIPTRHRAYELFDGKNFDPETQAYLDSLH